MFADHTSDPVGIGFGALIPSRRRVLRHIYRSLYFATPPILREDTGASREQILRQIVAYGQREKVISIAIDSFYAQTAEPRFEAFGFQTRRRWEFLLELQSPEGEIWQRMHPHHKRYAPYGGKRGLTFREDNTSAGVAALIELQENARKRTQRKGGDYSLASAEAYSSLKTSILDRGYGSIFLTEKDGVATSAVLVATYNGKAYLIFAGTSPEGYQLRAPVFLYWNAAMELKKRGLIEWNLGGVPWEAHDQASQSHGLFQFKGRFGVTQVACTSAEMPTVKSVRSAIRNLARAMARKSF
jgi:hypothetical protein